MVGNMNLKPLGLDSKSSTCWLQSQLLWAPLCTLYISCAAVLLLGVPETCQTHSPVRLSTYRCPCLATHIFFTTFTSLWLSITGSREEQGDHLFSLSNLSRFQRPFYVLIRSPVTTYTMISSSRLGCNLLLTC